MRRFCQAALAAIILAGCAGPSLSRAANSDAVPLDTIGPSPAAEVVDHAGAFTLPPIALAPVPPAMPAGDSAADPPPPPGPGPAATPAPEPEPAPVPAPAPSGTGTWVLAIGIDDYPGTSHDLLAGVPDARHAVEALVQGGAPSEQTMLLTDGDATGDGIRAGVRWLTEHVGPDGTAVVFYSGHVRSNGHGTQKLVGSDDDNVSDAELASLLEPLQARATWIVIAGCYAGGFTEVVAPGRIVTGASPEDQESFERGDASDLVRFLINEAWLSRRAGPSVQEAFAYTEARASAEYPDTVPVQYDQLGWPLVLGPPA